MTFVLLWLNPLRANAQASPVGIAVGGDNLTRLLWNNPDGSISLWKLDANGSVATQNSYGPYAGWSASALTMGPDNFARVLCTHPADGKTSLWRVDPSSPASPNSADYGPYSGWTALSVGVGGNNAPRLLWNHTADSLMSLWNITPDMNFTYGNYGPYAGYTAFRVACGPNSVPRTLWNKTDGSISLWYSTADAPDYSHNEYGPFGGWSPAALAVDSGNAPRLLWSHPSDGTVSLWKVAGDGTFTQQTYTDPAGYSPVALAAGTSGDVRLLWGNGQGQAQVWTIQSSGTYTSKTYPIATARLTSLTISPYSVAGGSTATGTVTLSSPAPAGGAVVSLSKDSSVINIPVSVLVPSGSSTASFTVATAKPASGATATVTAAYAGVSSSASININSTPIQTGGPTPPTGASPDYKIFANPVNVDVTQTASGSTNAAVTINVSPVNSYNGNVYLYLPTLPSGVTASLSSSVVSTASGDASSDLIFTVASNARPGYYTINLQSTSSYDSSSKYTPIGLNILPAIQSLGFNITQSSDGLDILPGTSDTITLTLNSNSGFSGGVGLDLLNDPDKPSNLTAAASVTSLFSRTSLDATHMTSVLTIQVGSQVAEGFYHLLVRATASTGTQVLPLTVYILPIVGSYPATTDPQPVATQSGPPFPLASSVSDMLRFDYDDSTNNLTSSSRAESSPASEMLLDKPQSNPQDDDDPAGLRPNFIGKTDDRIYIRDTYPSSAEIPYPYSAICHITLVSSGGVVFSGSGTMIGKNHVLTAAHVLYDNNGKRATVVKVYPGYDNGVSKAYGYAYIKRAFIPQGYQQQEAQGKESPYDDWAVIDLKPSLSALGQHRNKPLGTRSSFMHAVDDFVDPTSATVAGYPDVVRGGLKNGQYLYYSASSIGDDGLVTSSPPGGTPSNTPDGLVFSTIDVSHGDSGGPVFHPDPIGNDFLFHVFAVTMAMDNTFNDFTLITSRRREIINTVMHNDGDEGF